VALSAAAPAAQGADFNCSWTAPFTQPPPASDNWNNAANWSACNGTVPNNAAGNTYDATISAGNPQLTTGITIGNVAITGASDLSEWDLLGGAAATLTGGLNNSGGNLGRLTIDSSGAGGSTLNIGGTFINTGLVQIGNFSISSPSTVTAAALDNTSSGEILILGGATSQAVLQLGSGLTTLTGRLYLYDASSQVQVIGNTANNSALTTLTSVAGLLNLTGGSSLTTAKGLTNSGTLVIGSGGVAGGGTLNIGGVLTNSGEVALGSNTLARVTATTAGLDNSGSVLIFGPTTDPSTLTGPADFIVNGAASNSGTVEIEGGGTLGRVVRLVEMPTAGISDGQVTGLSGLIK
jgi:hypothetical protein